MPWPIAAQPEAGHLWPSAPLHERLLLLAPRSAERLAADGLAAGHRFMAGWAAFRNHAPVEALDLIAGLDHDPSPLLASLAGLPRTGLHGDLKLANVALLGDGRIALIDWQLTAIAPVAVELGWLLVSNSAALPEGPERILERYRAAASRITGSSIGPVAPFDPALAFPGAALDAVLGDDPAPRYRTMEATLGDWDVQLDLVWIIGLLLRGWRKGLDTEAGAILASGVPAADDLATWSDRAVEAAHRRL